MLTRLALGVLYRDRPDLLTPSAQLVKTRCSSSDHVVVRVDSQLTLYVAFAGLQQWPKDLVLVAELGQV